MSFGHCKDCRHWKRVEVRFAYGAEMTCAKIGVSEPDAWNYVPSGTSLAAIHDLGEPVYLVTEADFGCPMFAPSEGDEQISASNATIR